MTPINVHAAQQNTTTAESETETGDEKPQPQPWQPPAPSPEEFDWIQLNFGEWLKGELKVLYENKLEFDSDELGLLELDWENVQQVRSHRSFSVLLEGSITVEGLLQLTEEKVFITIGEDRQAYDRRQLVTIAPGEPREINYWSAKISFGFNLTTGNTEQTQWSTIANIMRRTSRTRIITDWLGNFTETDGEQTIDNQRASATFDVFRTRKYFLRPVFRE